MYQAAIMLKEGLIDEISVILSPCIVGNSNSAHFINPAVSELPKACHLKLRHVNELENGLVWLKYDVIKNERKKVRSCARTGRPYRTSQADNRVCL